MIEIRRILCPVDFSDFSRRALDHAVAIAQWYEATVTALHVFSPAPVAAFGPGPVAFEPIVLTAVNCDQLLADTKAFAETESAPSVTVEAVVREGYAAAAILEQAASMKADLLVIGTHGRSGFERLALGSVAEKVLRKANCPVLTVPNRLPDVPAGPVLYKRILCPIDFSDSSLHALKYAMSMAQEADGQLTVLHVVAHEFEYRPRDGARQGDEHWRLHDRNASRLYACGFRTAVGGRDRVLQHGAVDDVWKALARSPADRRRAAE